MRSWLVTLVAASLVLAACSDSDSDGEGAEQSSTPTTLNTGTPAPSATATPAPPGRRVVYAEEVGFESSGNRRWPILEVVTFDLDAQREVSRFRVGRAGEFAYIGSMALVGDAEVVLNLEKRLVVRTLDGSGERELLTAPEGSVVTTFAVSHDERLVAVGLEDETILDRSRNVLVVLEFESGREIQRFDQSAFDAAEFLGAPGVRTWWADNSAIELYTIFHRGGPGLTGTAFMDGHVELHGGRRQAIADDGSRAADAPRDGLFSCSGEGWQPTQVTLAELGGPNLAEISTDGFTSGAVRWSPDSTEVLLISHPIRTTATGEPCYVWQEATWSLWRDGAITPVANVETVVRRWEGDEFVDVFCDGVRVPQEYPQRGRVVCAQPARDLAFTIAGVKLDAGAEVVVLGLLDAE